MFKKTHLQQVLQVLDLFIMKNYPKYLHLNCQIKVSDDEMSY